MENKPKSKTIKDSIGLGLSAHNLDELQEVLYFGKKVEKEHFEKHAASAVMVMFTMIGCILETMPENVLEQYLQREAIAFNTILGDKIKKMKAMDDTQSTCE